jgi:hypothetical protein
VIHNRTIAEESCIMTKRELTRRIHQDNALTGLGFTAEEAESLRRISMTLRRWYERECGDGHGCIERDEATGRPYWHHAMSGRRYPIPDRERGAEKRLKAIVDRRNNENPEHVPLSCYLQTDPRGASLYLIRPGDVPDGGMVDAYYSRGVCVY